MTAFVVKINSRLILGVFAKMAEFLGSRDRAFRVIFIYSFTILFTNSAAVIVFATVIILVNVTIVVTESAALPLVVDGINDNVNERMNDEYENES